MIHFSTWYSISNAIMKYILNGGKITTIKWQRKSKQAKTDDVELQ